MPPALSLPCPAKINLFLEVRFKRPDGFHELGTLFQAVEAGDTLQAEPADSLSLAGADGITERAEDNLVLRAARLLQARFPERVPERAGIRFTLEKHLPSGAGLGGGSSDAAAALRLADRIWNATLTDAELIGLGAELGSDVPFFLAATTAYGEGRGELLTPAPPPRPFHVVIATPRCHVETPWAYRALGAWREETHGDPGVLPGTRWEAFRKDYPAHMDDPAFYVTLHNDFQEPVERHFPEIREIREALQDHGPVKALLSGSGASVFALFEQEEAARQACEAVAPRCRFAVTTRFRRASPG